jgi:dihydrofolate reductase
VIDRPNRIAERTSERTHPVSKLLYSATMSLDGFIAGVGGDMTWLTELLVSAPEVDGLMAEIGALLVGRRTFSGDDPNAGTDSEGAFGGNWHGRCVVLTHQPPAGPPVPDVTFCSDLADAVAAAKSAAGGRYVNVLGANVAKQCLEAGILDEILVLIAPVLLGDGTRLFEHPGGTNVRLETLDRPQLGPASMWCRVAR